MTIPFDKTIETDYGAVRQLSPLVRRVGAKNPGPFTFTGTGTYIIGQGDVAVIDPGPRDEAHIGALLAALEGETVRHILITHTHLDHSPGAALLQAETGAPTYGFGPHGSGAPDDVVVEEGGDMDFVPDQVLGDGDRVTGGDWSLEAVHTPGHTSNHLCFAMAEEAALFTGDHVMGWSTTIVSPPDGDMAAYRGSLAKLLERDEQIYYPTHGVAMHEPKALVSGLIAHRVNREAQIMNCLVAGQATISEMVPVMYTDIDPRLHPAAARSVLAHLIHMVGSGQVRCEGLPDIGTRYIPVSSL